MSRGAAWPAFAWIAGTLLVGCAPALAPASAPLSRDDFGRYTLAVTLNGKGPFPFVLDTGAEMSMIAPALAESLHLGGLPGVEVKVQGTAGEQASSFVNANTMQTALFAGGMESFVVLPNTAITNVPGILGTNRLRGSRLEIDFPRSTARVGPSGVAPQGYAALKATLQRNAFVFVDVVVDGVKAQALVDTGARRTVGNLALARALGFADGDQRLVPTDALGGASVSRMAARMATVGAVTLGPARFAGPSVAFADVPVFKAQGRDKAPALILGIDLLGKLDALAIDYPRAEVQVRP